jgi:hypothetical protein
MTVRSGHLTSFFATGASSRGSPIRGFVDDGPDGLRAFRNRNARRGIPVPKTRSSFQSAVERAPRFIVLKE